MADKKKEKKIKEPKVKKERKPKEPKVKKEKAKQDKNHVKTQSELMTSLSRRLAIVMGIGIVALIVTIILNNLVTGSIEDQYTFSKYSKDLSVAINYQNSLVQGGAATGEKQYMDDYNKEIGETKSLEKALNGMKSISLTAQEKKDLDMITEISKALVPLETRIFQYGLAGGTEEAIKMVYKDDYKNSVNRVITVSDDIVGKISKRVANKVKTLKMICVVAELILGVVFLIIIKELLGFIKFSKRELLNPIIKVKDQMLLIAEGNFSVHFDMNADETEVGEMVGAIHAMKATLRNVISDLSRVLEKLSAKDLDVTTKAEYIGELGTLEVSVKNIVENLNAIMRSIEVTAEEVARGAELIAGGSQAVADGATDQASSVEQLQATITDVASETDRNAGSAKEADSMAKKVGKELRKSNEQMQTIVDAMGEISESSNKIGDIIQTIHSIAAETNLLALNAAIEAARAGEAGKGFAVVADEVAKLAGDSKAAAGTTTELIEASLEAVETGIGIVNITAAKLDDAVKRAEELIANINQISEASERQSYALDQVTAGVEQISCVVEENSAMSQESASAAEELTAQAQTLKEMVKEFNIREN